MSQKKNKIKEFIQFSIKNSGTLFILKLLGLGLNYFILLLILHFYDFKGNGEYAVVLELARGLKVFVVFGLDYLLVKELTSINTQNRGLESLLGTFLVNNFLFFLLFSFCHLIFDLDMNIFYWTIFMSVWRFTGHYYRGKDSMVLYGFFEFVIFQLIALTSIICSNFIFNGFNFETIINILSLLVIVFLAAFKLPKILSQINKSVIETIKITFLNLYSVYKKGFHFVLTNSTNILSISILYVIIKENYSSEVLGVYDTVLKFAMIVSLPLIAASGRVMTLSAQYFNNDKMNELRSYIHNITRMLIIVSTLAAIGVSIFFIVYSFYFNITLKDYWLLFAVLVAGQLVNNWTGPVGIVLQVTNNEKIFNRITMLFGAYLVFSTFILAKFFDIYIIAINMLLYLSCVNYFALRVQKRKLDIRPHKKLLKK
ncbi:MAG: hypothetical protein CMO82_02010 [Winogradskyella sp.]|uniref:Polysaccharide biosynthesis protein n=1 Tax=Winogradskyella poriferorum TaxID=307627 RepID=A0ABU7W3N0_9FLAO|nr:hypothetical protein [Winogradskyella sp.]